MNVANWLSLLRHGFWQYVKQVFMLNTFQVFDVRTDLAYKGTDLRVGYDINPPLLSGDFIQLPNQPEY